MQPVKLNKTNGIVYTKLCDVGENSKAGQEFNIYGIIIECMHKVSYDYLHQYQNEYRLKLKDGTNDECIDVTIFAILDNVPHIAFDKGNIVRFHRLLKKKFKNSPGFYLCGKLGPVSALMFELPKNGEKFAHLPTFRTATDYTQSPKDLEIESKKSPSKCKVLAELVKNADKILGTFTAPDAFATPRRFSHSVLHIGPSQSLSQESMPVIVSNAASQSSPSQQKNNASSKPSTPKSTTYRYVPIVPVMNAQSKKHETCIEIRHMICANSGYYNLICEVVSCYINSKGNVILRVWDGTQNATPTHITNGSYLDLLYGNLPRQVRIAAAKRLYEVCCYDEHGEAAKNLKAGDYVVLINVHFFVQKTINSPYFVMHDGKGWITLPNNTRISADRRISKITEEESAEHYNFLRKNILVGEAIINKVDDDGFDEDLELSDLEASKIAPVSTFAPAQEPEVDRDQIEHQPQISTAAAPEQPRQKSTTPKFTQIQHQPQISPITPRKNGINLSKKSTLKRVQPSKDISDSQSCPCAKRFRPEEPPHQVTQIEEFYPTQALFEKLKPKPSTQSEEEECDDTQSEDDEIELGAPSELEQMLDEITPSQEEKMWSKVENAELQSSQW